MFSVAAARAIETAGLRRLSVLTSLWERIDVALGMVDTPRRQIHELERAPRRSPATRPAARL